MSFWQSDDKIPILQTKVKIPAENGLNFTQGQVIHMTIPSQGVEFFQPKESYLEFTVNLGDQPTNGKTRLCLDAELGGHVLIRDISIYQNGPGGQLIEQIQNYNTLTAIKYDYESDETLRSKRALTEGCSQYSSNCRSTRQCIKSDLNNVGHNQYWQPYTYGGQLANNADGGPDQFVDSYNTSIATANVASVPGQQKVKCQLQLNTGIFSSSKVYPNLLTDGLRIEIQLEDGARCLRTLDTVNPLRQARNTCIVHGTTGLDTAAGMTMASATNFNTIFIKRDNNITDLANFPLVVGEKIAVVDNTVSFLDAAVDKRMVAQLTGTDGSNCPVIKNIEWASGDAAGDTNPGGYWGMVKITLDQNYQMPGAELSFVAGDWSLVSQSVSTLLTPTGGGTAGGWVSGVNYTVEDVNFILQKLSMPPQYVQSMMSMMKSGGTINYDFLTATNYKYSQLKSDVVANIRLPLSQSRCRGILSVPTDASVYAPNKQMAGYGDLQADGILTAAGLRTAPAATDADKFTYTELLAKSKSGSVDTPSGVGYQAVNSVRSGLVGCWDHATRYQWYYAGQLNPARPISLEKLGGKKSIEQQAMIELEKGLSVCGIRPLSFRKYQQNAIIARALSLQSGTYNAVGKDFNLQIEYGSTTAPEKNKLWHNFVHHIRRLEIKGNAVSIIV
tara:strand:- start:1373 stop:3388 length:2016 start_codon:yes stop_codon:yes gene_type:complete